MSNIIDLSAKVPEELDGQRLDQALAKLFPQYSRRQHQNWIKQEVVTIDKAIASKTRQAVSTEQIISLKTTESLCQENWQAQNIPLDVIHEDEAFIIINKPAGLTVHPGAGQADNTLVNALKYYCPQLETLPRAGLVHRLDKNTSGLLVVAKTMPSYNALVSALEERKISRHYLALVHGSPIAGGDIEAAIGRDRNHRTKMAVDGGNSKYAFTSYRINQRMRWHSLLEVKLATGRTHQIRVHLAHIKYPIIGDQLYGRGIRPSAKLTSESYKALNDFRRQALHAHTLEFNHPLCGEICKFIAPMPKDMDNLVKLLAADAELHNAEK